MSATSPFGPDLAVLGLNVSGGTGSPEASNQIANITDISLPVMCDTIDVTNVGDTWKRHVPTLLDMGKITLKAWYIPKDLTHNAAAGLRYLMINRLISTFTIAYPDGVSVDSFPAYVTQCAVTGKVGGAFEVSIELSNSGAPTLC
jgi:hypothetical protein